MKKLILFLLLLPILAPAQILGSYSWETGNLTQGVFSLFSLCNKPYDAQIVTTASRDGAKCVRFELRSTDTVCGGSIRTELYISKDLAISKQAQWFAYSDSLPAAYAYDENSETSFQFHQPGGAWGPKWEIWRQRDIEYLVQSLDTDGDSVAVTKFTKTIGPVAKGRWRDWVVHYIPSLGADGVLQVWLNGTLVADVTGPNTNRLTNGVEEGNGYIKFGCYKWGWHFPGPFTVSTRILFIDRVMIGGAACTINDFRDTMPVPPVPVPPVLISFPARL